VSEAGDAATFARCRSKAEELRKRFNEDFWLDGLGMYALGLDADKRPIDAVASNIGHCLWTGIVDPERAGQVAERLVSSELFSGWASAHSRPRWPPTTPSATTTAPCGPTTTRSAAPVSPGTATSRKPTA